MPRAVLVDLEPGTMDSERSGPFGKQFRQTTLYLLNLTNPPYFYVSTRNQQGFKIILIILCTQGTNSFLSV